MKELTEHNGRTNINSPSPTAPYVVLCEHPVGITNPKLVNAVMNGHLIYQTDIYDVTRQVDWQFVRQNMSFRFLARFIKRYLSLHGDVLHFIDYTTGEYLYPLQYVPCGKCDLCRNKKRNMYAAMCQMECQQHDRLPIFVTLTYDNPNLPLDGLNYRDFQLFMKNLRNVYREFDVPVKDRKPLRFCMCGEYGDADVYSGRPHYHVLIWDFPTHLFNHRPLDIDKYIRDIWKLGLTDTKHCYSGDTGFYIGKYIAKNEIPEGSVQKPFVRHSANLGVSFVKKTCEAIMRENPTFTDFKYKDKFTGHVKQLPLIMYYIKKMFPTVNAIPAETRQAIRDYNWLCDIDPFFKKFDLPEFLTDEFTYGDYYTGLNPYDDTSVVARSLELVHDLEGRVVPNFNENRAVIDQYLNFLFTRLGDQDVAAMAYNIRKKNANERCWRANKKQIKYQKYEY